MLSEKLVKMFVKDLRYACADSGDEELERVIDNLFSHGLIVGEISGGDAVKKEITQLLVSL